MIEEIIGHVFGEGVIGEFDDVGIVDEVDRSGNDSGSSDEVSGRVWSKDSRVVREW